MGRTGSIPRAMLALLVALALASPGCSTWRAARLYQSGTAALDRGQADRAIADLEQAAALAPEASEIRNHLGLAQLAAGREHEALASFQQAVDLDCDNAAASGNLAVLEAHFEQARQDAAIAAISEPADRADRERGVAGSSSPEPPFGKRRIESAHSPDAAGTATGDEQP